MKTSRKWIKSMCTWNNSTVYVHMDLIHSNVRLLAFVSFLFSQSLFCGTHGFNPSGCEKKDAISKSAISKSAISKSSVEPASDGTTTLGGTTPQTTPEPVRVVLADEKPKAPADCSHKNSSEKTVKVAKAEVAPAQKTDKDDKEVEPFDFEKFAKYAKDLKDGKYDKKVA